MENLNNVSLKMKMGHNSDKISLQRYVLLSFVDGHNDGK